MAAACVLQRSSDDQYYFNLRAGNNQVILTSERYSTKASAENGIAGRTRRMMHGTSG